MAVALSGGGYHGLLRGKIMPSRIVLFKPDVIDRVVALTLTDRCGKSGEPTSEKRPPCTGRLPLSYATKWLVGTRMHISVAA
jgi:hypothetical protein